MGCARCHDHKFDPLAMSDYYALAGIFKSTRTMLAHSRRFQVEHDGAGRCAVACSAWKTSSRSSTGTTMRSSTATPNSMSDQERSAHAALLEEAKKEYAAIPKAMAVAEGPVSDLEIFLRGNHLTRGPVVPRRLPTILAGVDQPPMSPKASGRLELARWLTGPRNPLTARVIVNRVWRWHFGQGLVRSVDNFGKLGEPPSHPELLDWLAIRFIEDGWSFKTLHRRIMLSATYQMSTAWNEQAAPARPGEPTALADAPPADGGRGSCATRCWPSSGSARPAMGGHAAGHRPRSRTCPSPESSATAALYQSDRRSVYLPVLRSALYEVFQAFDFPDPAVPNGDRATTTVASQALFMMNGPIVERPRERLADDPAGARSRDRSRSPRWALPPHPRPARRAGGTVADGKRSSTRYQAAPSLAA